METPLDFPKMPEPGGRAHLLESSASMSWTLLFLAYSSSTFISEFPQGRQALWTLLLVAMPIVLVGLPNILDKRRNSVKNLLFFLIYIILPAVIQLSKPSVFPSTYSHFADLATALILWLPLEFGLLAKEISPTGTVTAWGLLISALNILNLFSVIRPFSDLEKAHPLGYSFKLTPLKIGIALFSALVYLVCTVPLAILLRFGRLKRPPRLTPEQEFATFLGLYMSAITEELLFRGVMQNMLEQRLGRQSPIALAVAAIPYAISHAQKEKLGYMKPNYRYAVVTFAAGCVCGLAWRYTGRVTASALTRALGDYVLYRVALSKKTGQ